MMSHEDIPLPWLAVHLQAPPRKRAPAAEVTYLGRQLTTQDFEANSPPTAMICSFEQAMDALGQLERLFIEPDGSFVWRGQSQHGHWQIDGMIYDREGAVQWCEIKGTCPLSKWHALLRGFGWPYQALMVHLLDRQIFALVEDIDILWLQTPTR